MVATGAWTTGIAARLGLTIAVKPMRGQIVMLCTPRQIFQRTIEWLVDFGYHYLQPRDDGRLLVGTTMEDVGFDRANTAEAIGTMLQFATKLAPVLKQATMERAWCGFRPASRGWVAVHRRRAGAGERLHCGGAFPARAVAVHGDGSVN